MGAAGGVVKATAALDADTSPFAAATRNSYEVLASRPPTSTDVAFAAVAAPDIQAPELFRYSTRKAVSLDDSSVQVTVTVVEPSAVAATPVGASLGLDNPLVECFARARKA